MVKYAPMIPTMISRVSLMSEDEAENGDAFGGESKVASVRE